MKTLRMLTVLAAFVAVVDDADAKPRKYAAAYACNHGSKTWTHREARCAISRVWRGSKHLAGALRVANCESGYNVYEVTGQFKGLWQIGKAYHPDAPRNLFDPVATSAWVRQVTRDGTRWSAWQCSWAAR